MIENDRSQLSQFRFQINPESREILFDLRDFYHEIHQSHPEIQGIGFFGSRIRAMEREKSDFDIMVYVDNGSEQSFGRYKFGDSPVILDLFRNHLKSWGFTFNRDRPPAIINIVSSGATSSYVNQLITSHSVVREIHPKQLSSKDIMYLAKRPEIFFLYSRFFMAIGDGIHKCREDLFNLIELKENGEIIFQTLMDCLQCSERYMPRKKHGYIPEYLYYPHSISEARLYFSVNRTECYNYT